ncbi:MAG TPA: 16S rRNA (uracil(1498)-N(3))-methyltransferase [Thermoanaerobaculia bacterium]|nr:16S rRNA (uracil(1498)-N(3))-methyltransferase [Thermoanaerobaculia bacterium]
MNLVLLFDDDFVSADCVRLTGRRLQHVAQIHRAKPGDELTVGVAGGRIGRGRITDLREDALEMEVVLDREPPPPLGVTLVLALPRPKVLNRVIASTASMGVKRIYLVNAWRVEKSYWKSPRVDPANLAAQAILGLEQARDTILPDIHLRRFFRPFAEDELPRLIAGTRALVAHPYAGDAVPRATSEAVTLAVGPEGGFTGEEIASLAAIGFVAVHLGPRILRVETAVTALLARLSHS